MSIQEQLDRLAAFSSTDPAQEGVTRLPFSKEQVEAARWLGGCMEQLGLEVQIDAYGTVAGFLQGQKEQILLLGSHYDSVPRGGRYDGCAGVMAALDVVRRLREAGERPWYSIMVLALNDEEGVRLSEGFLSSHAVCGYLSYEDEKRICDRTTGQPLAELLDASPFQRQAIRLPPKARAYVEFHVEQGPVLDEKGLAVGIVDHIVGVYHCFYQLQGVQNHAGTTPMSCRVDPVTVFGRVAGKLPAIAQRYVGSVATIGFLDVHPNVPNVIADSVRFSVDLRAADPEVLAKLCAEAEQLVRSEAAQEGVTVTQTPSTNAAPVTMNKELVAVLERCTERLGLHVFHMDSGAGHDAQVFATRLPTAMLFARSRAGLSHCKEEHTDESDLNYASDILYQFVKEPFE